MLGEKIGEEHGKVTSRRVLKADDPRYLSLEISFETESTVLGVQGMNIGTYVVFERMPGQLYGEGQGIFMGAHGESGIWNGHGVGSIDASGVMRFASSITFQTDAENLKRLNGVLGVVEHSADMAGNVTSTIHEWKP